MINFFKRIGTVKHKFKVEFIIDKLSMDLALTEQLSIVVKRGEHKQQTKHATLKKGAANFKKQILVFDPVTMFYEPDTKVYTEKEGQIRLIIHTQSGDKKLGGVIKFDLATYVNDKFQYKKQQQPFEKCPEKAKNSSLTYEVYIKFLRESNSQTGSELGALTKDSKKDKSKKLNQTEQPTKSKKNNQSEVKDSVLDTQPDPPRKKKTKQDSKIKKQKDTKASTNQQQQIKTSKSKNKTLKPVVYFDKDRNSSAQDGQYSDPNKDEFKSASEIGNTLNKKAPKVQSNKLKVIGHKKAVGAPKSEDSDNGEKNQDENSQQQIEVKKKPEKKSKKESELAPKTLQIKDLIDDAPTVTIQPMKQKKSEPPALVKKNSLKPELGGSLKAVEKRPQSPPPMIVINQPIDPYKRSSISPQLPVTSMLQIPTSMTVLRPTERTQKATQQFYEQQIAKLQKENGELEAQKQSLSLKVAKLTQTLSLKQKEVRDLKQQKRSDNTLERKMSMSGSGGAIGGGNRVKELQIRLAEVEKQRGMELLDHQSLKSKLDEMQSVVDDERRKMETEMAELDEQYKKSLKQMKEQLAQTKQKLEKSQKDRKQFERDRISYKKQIQAKTSEMKQMSIQLKEALDDLTRKKLQVSQAMNDASEEQNQKLIEFIENHFF